MKDLWNDSSVKSPPILSLPSISITKNNCSNLQMILERLYNTEKYFSALRIEWNILKAVAKKTACQFRNMHSFKKMQQTEKALKDLFDLDALPYLKKFSNSFVKTSKKKKALADFYPSRQMLQYLLLRFQTLAKSLHRLRLLSFAGSRIFYLVSSIGHKNSASLTLFAIGCRISYVSRHLLNEIIICYNHLLDFNNHLPAADIEWLPKSYKFPYDLRKWIVNDPKAFEESAATIVPIFTVDCVEPVINLLSDTEEIDDDIQVSVIRKRSKKRKLKRAQCETVHEIEDSEESVIDNEISIVNDIFNVNGTIINLLDDNDGEDKNNYDDDDDDDECSVVEID